MNRISPFQSPVLTILLLAIWASTTSAAPELTPRIIESALVIPAGSYRDPHPLKLKGGFNIDVKPGAILEELKFEDKDGSQKWSADGDLFRKVRIGGTIGSVFTASNCAFEDCEFVKEAGSWVDIWTSRWVFNNCVITGRFFHDPGVTDYSIRAVNCTFIGVKMPAIGLKNDPAAYLQTDDLKFENCRFVQCDVPRTVLAASVNCVFDNCQFPSKSEWPKQMTPVTVKAYYGEASHPPQAVSDGPLTAQFESAMNRKAGCTLRFLHTGGRLSLDDLRPGAYTTLEALIGASDKGTTPAPKPLAASPATPAPATGAPATPAPLAPTARTEALGGTAGVEFDDQRSNGSLVGFHIAYGTYFDHRIIGGLQPIYQTANGKVDGAKFGTIDQVDATVEARAGYVVAGIDLTFGHRVNGFDVVFKRPADNMHLQSAGSYTSDWYGDGDGKGAKSISAEGRPIVGIIGRANESLVALGLIYRGPPLPGAPQVAAANPAPAVPTPPAPAAEPKRTDLVQDTRESLVFVEGAAGQGSGFICNLGGHKLLITNAHVVAGIHAPAFKLLDRSPIQVGQGAVAVGHDIAALGVTSGGKAMEAMTSVDTETAIGDEVVVLGNSEGAGVIHPLPGKIVGLGPNLVEVDAPFVPGNSGSPIIHKRTGKVIGVATYLMIRRFPAEGGNGVRTEARRFGYRLDSVKDWQPIVWANFYSQAAEMEKIKGLTGDLVKFVEDMSSGAIHPEQHQNPVIRQRIDAWYEVRKRRGISRADVETANADLLSFLKIACQSDITQARRQFTYNYFQRELDTEKVDRNQLSELFAKLVKIVR